MLRSIAGVIVGYMVMFVVVFATFTVTYLAMGTDGSFKPGSYDVSTAWIVVTSVLGLIAAVAGGFVCAWIGRSGMATFVLAGLVLVLGLLMAFPTLNAEPPTEPRPAEVDNFAAMQNAQTPPIAAFLNPIIGAVGVLIGARLKGGKGSGGT